MRILGKGLILSFFITGLLLLIIIPSVFASGFYIKDEFDSLNGWNLTGSNISSSSGSLSFDTTATTATTAKKTVQSIPDKYIAEFKVRIEALSGSQKFGLQIYDGTNRLFILLYGGNTMVSGSNISPAVLNPNGSVYVWRAVVDSGFVTLYRGDENGGNMIKLNSNPVSLQSNGTAPTISFYAESGIGIKVQVDYIKIYSGTIIDDVTFKYDGQKAENLISGNTLTTGVSIINGDISKAQDALVVSALYDKDNMMLGFNFEKIKIEAGKSDTISIPLLLSQEYGELSNCKIMVYVWDSILSMQSYTDNIVFPNQ